MSNFSSNQVLTISGDLTSEDIEKVINFFMNYSGYNKNYLSIDEVNRGCKIVYQITETGRYCIGWGFETIPDGWTEYPFEFEPQIVALIIQAHIENLSIDNKYADLDGSSSKGFIAKAISEEFVSVAYDHNTDIKNPFYGIVSFEPFMNYYSK